MPYSTWNSCELNLMTHQHCSVSCSSTADAVKPMLVAGMFSDTLHRPMTAYINQAPFFLYSQSNCKSKLSLLVSLTAHRSSLNEPHFKTSGFPFLYIVSKPTIINAVRKKKTWHKHQTKKEPSEAFKLHELQKTVTVKDKKFHPIIYLQQMTNTVQTNNLEKRTEKQEREHHDTNI